MSDPPYNAALGRLGVWAVELRSGEPAESADAAAELEDLGYATLWFPGGRGGDVFAAVDHLLRATSRATIATGILNLWAHAPAEVGEWWRSLAPSQQQRVMLGIGVGHGPVIGEAWKAPVRVISDYLDKLDAEGIPLARRCLAALGPKMQELARDRSAGAHPYLVTPDHTLASRAQLGPSALLAPEQGVILETDPAAARQAARHQLTAYAHLPNYQNNWKRLGMTDEDVSGLSDRLVDALFAWGTPEQVARRIAAHFDAGADHVCIQVVVGMPGSGRFQQLRQSWRELAAVLLDGAASARA